MLRWDRESSQIDERNGDCLTWEDFATDICVDKHTLWYRQLMSAMSDVSVADLVPFNGSGRSVLQACENASTELPDSRAVVVGPGSSETVPQKDSSRLHSRDRCCHLVSFSRGSRAAKLLDAII